MQFAKLHDCCTFIKDGTHSSPERVPEGIPVLSAGNVIQGKLNFNTDRFTTIKELKIFQNRLHPKPDDILLTIVGTIGRVALLTEDRPLVFQRSVCVLRPRQNTIDSYYLRYVLESSIVKSQLEIETHEATQAGVYLESLNEIMIPLPDIIEQKRIADILRRADRLSRLRRYAREISDTYLQSVFLEMFGNPVTNPKGLDEKPLDSIVTMDKFAIVDGPFGSDLKAEEYTDNGVRVIRVNNIKPNAFNFDDIRYVSTIKYQSIKRSTVLPGDVIMAKVGNTLGKTCVFPDSIQYAVLTANVCKVTLNTDIALPFFICYQMNLEGLQQSIRSLSGDTAKPMINIPRLRELNLIIPKLADQKRFVEIVLSHRRIQSRQKETKRQVEHLFQTLLHKAFQGEFG